jgi:hypothetical protein
MASLTETPVVVCADMAAVPAAIPGAPCPAGSGLVTKLIELPATGSAFDAVEASGFFFFGFGVIVFAYLLGFVVQQVRSPIR